MEKAVIVKKTPAGFRRAVNLKDSQDRGKGGLRCESEHNSKGFV